MIHGQTKDLFQLQTELVDMKVDMAVSRTIDRVVDQITSLRNDMHSQIHGLRDEMHEFRDEVNTRFTEVNNRFSVLGERVTAIETKLGMKQETKAQIKSRVIEYAFKAISAISAVGFAYFVLQLQVLIK